MSISSIQSNIQRAQSGISSLTNKLSDLTRKLADKSRRLADAQNGASRATSVSAQQSKLKDVTNTLKEMASIEKDRAGVEKQIGDKKRELHRYEQDLAKERDRETKKQTDADKRRAQQMEEADRRRVREMASYQRSLDIDLSERHRLIPARMEADPAGIEANSKEPEVPKYDLFISHASEDKEAFVRPLAEALSKIGLAVWYDETTLTLGDSLRESIDKGLVNSRYGVVVLSTAFFIKNWPQYELNGMVAREMNGVKVILPIWHKVSKDEVLSYSPTLADKVALNSSIFSIEQIAEKLADVVKAE